MTPEVQAFATGFPLTLLHAGVTLLLLMLGATLYTVLSPHKEFAAIDAGHSAAAISLGGVVLGLAIPLAVALSASPSLLEIVLWGASIVVVQLLVFVLIDKLLGGLPQRAREGEVGAAALLASARVSAALILAAAVAG